MRGLAGGLGLMLVSACGARYGTETVAGGTPPSEAGASAIESCTKDLDCLAPSACWTGRCDPYTHACVYDLCPSATICSTGVCDPSTNLCGAPVAYGFRATTFEVSDALACPTAAACFAAVFPYVFVGTTAGVLAINVSNVVSNTPPRALVAGIDFKATRLVASGRRVWFVGDVLGTGAPYPLHAAVLDVPSRPSNAPLSAAAATLSYPYSGATALPAPNGNLLVAFETTNGMPAGIVTPPLSQITMFPSADVPSGHAPIGTSGERMITFAAPNSFSIETSPGTEVSRNAGSQGAGDEPLSRGSFAFGPDGSGIWAVEVKGPNDGSGCRHYQSKVWWIFNDAAAPLGGPFAAQAVPHNGACSGTQVGNPLVAWLDTNRALSVTHTADFARIVVETATRATTPPSLVPNRQAMLTANLATDMLASTSSHGFGYLLSASPTGATISVSTFAPDCE